MESLFLFVKATRGGVLVWPPQDRAGPPGHDLVQSDSHTARRGTPAPAWTHRTSAVRGHTRPSGPKDGEAAPDVSGRIKPGDVRNCGSPGRQRFNDGRPKNTVLSDGSYYYIYYIVTYLIYYTIVSKVITYSSY